MVIYETEIKERLKNGKSAPTERFRAQICEETARLIPKATVFYSAREQGTVKPAVFSRIEKLELCRGLGKRERVTMTVVLRYLPERSADDAESESFIEAVSCVAGDHVTAFCGERTEKGAKAVLTVCFEQEAKSGDTDGVMRVLKMNEE